MTEKETLQPSLLDQILAEAFQSLEASGDFNTATLQALQSLASKGQLSHAATVEKVLKKQEGGVP